MQHNKMNFPKRYAEAKTDDAKFELTLRIITYFLSDADMKQFVNKYRYAADVRKALKQEHLQLFNDSIREKEVNMFTFAFRDVDQKTIDHIRDYIEDFQEYVPDLDKAKAAVDLYTSRELKKRVSLHEGMSQIRKDELEHVIQNPASDEDARKAFASFLYDRVSNHMMRWELVAMHN